MLEPAPDVGDRLFEELLVAFKSGGNVTFEEPIPNPNAASNPSLPPMAPDTPLPMAGLAELPISPVCRPSDIGALTLRLVSIRAESMDPADENCDGKPEESSPDCPICARSNWFRSIFGRLGEFESSGTPREGGMPGRISWPNPPTGSGPCGSELQSLPDCGSQILFSG